MSARAQDTALKLPQFREVKLQNGLTVLLMEQTEVPIVSFSFIVKNGATADPPGKEGLADLTAGLLRKGTKTRTADQISQELDFVGGLFWAGAGLDYSSGGAEFLKKDTAKGIELLADVLINPAFPQPEVAKLLAQSIDGVKSSKDEAQQVIGAYFNSYLYGNHPYGRPVPGDEKSLAAISRADVLGFYSSYYTPSNVILAVAGDFNPAEMGRMLAEKFGAWRGKPAPAVSVAKPAVPTGKRLLLVDKPDATQTYYQIGNMGVSRTNPDRVYLGVVNTLFGGRFTSMLNTELRIKTGLTYGARSSFEFRLEPGPFVISTYTQNATTEKAIDMTLDILNRLHEKEITEQELQSAKAYLKGQYPPRIETTDQLASLIATLEFFGLDEREVNEYYARIDAMTLADAKRVIAQYYPRESLVFVLIGRASEIQPVARKYAAKVDSKSISAPGF